MLPSLAAACCRNRSSAEPCDLSLLLMFQPSFRWLGWADEWNSWEPRHHLDRPLTEYQLADGLALADLQ